MLTHSHGSQTLFYQRNRGLQTGQEGHRGRNVIVQLPNPRVVLGKDFLLLDKQTDFATQGRSRRHSQCQFQTFVGESASLEDAEMS